MQSTNNRCSLKLATKGSDLGDLDFDVNLESKISAAKRERDQPNYVEPTKIPSSRAREGRIPSVKAEIS